MIDFDEHALFLEPRFQYDDAIIGSLNGSGVVVYDAHLVIHITMSVHELDHADAIEYFYFNIAGSMGENYPEYVWVELNEKQKGNENGT